MKLEYLYHKDKYEENSGFSTQAGADRVRMTAEEREAQARANIDRFDESWEGQRSREGIYDENSFTMYREIIRKTEKLPMTADWI